MGRICSRHPGDDAGGGSIAYHQAAPDDQDPGAGFLILGRWWIAGLHFDVRKVVVFPMLLGGREMVNIRLRRMLDSRHKNDEAGGG